MCSFGELRARSQEGDVGAGNADGLMVSARGRGGKEKGEDYDYVAITIREYSYK